MTTSETMPRTQTMADARKAVAGASPEIRELILDAAEDGWEVTHPGGGHLRLTKPGVPQPIFAPFTPSSRRSVHNVESLLRRHGYRPKDQRQRRTRIRVAVEHQNTPDPSLEEEAFRLLDMLDARDEQIFQLQTSLREVVDLLHDEGEEGLHASYAGLCQRGCSRHLTLLTTRSHHGVAS